MNKCLHTLAVFLTLTFSTCIPVNQAHAIDMGSVIKAQIVLGQISQVVNKYKEVQALLDKGLIELDVEEPRGGSRGKFMLPFDIGGNQTAWAEKALNAKAGAAAGKMVADKAVGSLVSKVPVGGFLSGAAKSKVKETGAVFAMGGWTLLKIRPHFPLTIYRTTRFICIANLMACQVIKCAWSGNGCIPPIRKIAQKVGR